MNDTLCTARLELTDWSYLLLFIPLVIFFFIIWYFLSRPKKENTIGWSLYNSTSFKWLVILVMQIILCLLIAFKFKTVKISADKDGNFSVLFAQVGAKQTLNMADSTLRNLDKSESIYQLIGDEKMVITIQAKRDTVIQNKEKLLNLLLTQDTLSDNQKDQFTKAFLNFYGNNDGAASLNKIHSESEILYMGAKKAEDSLKMTLKNPLLYKK